MQNMTTRIDPESINKLEEVAKAKGLDRSIVVRQYIAKGLASDAAILRSGEAFLQQAIKSGIPETQARELYQLARAV